MPRRLASAIVIFCATGCPPAETPAPKQAPPVAGEESAVTKQEAPPSEPPENAMGRVLAEAPLPLLAILGAEPAVAESHLGPPLGKGVTKKSCVRFLPERVFFTCAQAWQRYSDPTGNFTAIEVRYEDGRAGSIAFEGLKGDGEVEPRAALAKVGLELPGEPQVDNPAADVTRWSWFNAAARLRVHERQYRVEVSTVRGTWATAKVDVILNEPLTE